MHAVASPTSPPPALSRRDDVDRYLPLARFAAAHGSRAAWSRSTTSCRSASIGLLHAIDRYDPANGAAFSSYALPTITGELRRHFRDHGWMVRPPRDLQEDALRVERSSRELQAKGRHAPTVQDVAARHAASLSPVADDDSPRLEARLARHRPHLSQPPKRIRGSRRQGGREAA